MATTKKKKSNTTSTTTTASAASTQINTQKTVTLQDIPFIKYLKSRPNSGKTVTSMKMAILLNQQHNHLLKAIRQQIDYMVAYNDDCIRTGKEDEKLNIQEYFIPSEYIDANNQKRPCYNITVIGYEYLILKQQSKNNFIFLLQYIKNFDSTLNSYKQLLDVFNLQNEQYSNKTVIEKLDALSEKVEQLQPIYTVTAKPFPTPKYTNWKQKILKIIKQYIFYINTEPNSYMSISNVIALIINKMEFAYDVDIESYVTQYQKAFGFNKTDFYILDVINYYDDLKNMFTATLNHLTEGYNITV